MILFVVHFPKKEVCRYDWVTSLCFLGYPPADNVRNHRTD